MMNENANNATVSPKIIKPILFVRYGDGGSASRVEIISRGAEVSPPSRHEDTSNTISSGFSSSTV